MQISEERALQAPPFPQAPGARCIGVIELLPQGSQIWTFQTVFQGSETDRGAQARRSKIPIEEMPVEAEVCLVVDEA